MEIHFTIGLNFWHFWIFAFTSLPEHWTTIVLSQQHLSYLSGHIISSKITGFKIKMQENILLKRFSVNLFFTLEKLHFCGSILSQSVTGPQLTREIWLFSSVFLLYILVEFLEATLCKDWCFTQLFIRFSDIFLLMLCLLRHYCEAMWESEKHLANPTSWLQMYSCTDLVFL